VYERLKQLATRLSILPITDLPRSQAIAALCAYRKRYFSKQAVPTASILSQVYDLVGGRLTFLSRVAKAEDMLAECEAICTREKIWFLNQCWILGGGSSYYNQLLFSLLSHITYILVFSYNNLSKSSIPPLFLNKKRENQN
jgi:hypothetical protein